jgi:hypothetical protein
MEMEMEMRMIMKQRFLSVFILNASEGLEAGDRSAYRMPKTIYFLAARIPALMGRVSP